MEESQPSPRESREKPAAGAEKAEQELVFYYSRARRLERASQTVRELNDPAPVRRPTLFGTLTATKPLTFLFMSMVILVAGILITSYFSSREERPALGGNSLTLSAMRFEGSSYIVIKKTVPEKTEAYTGIVDIAVSLYVKPGEEYPGELPLANRRIYFSPEPEEEYRMTVPFEARELLFVMRAEEAYLSLRVKPE
ncbi:MAG: hypothetical protein LBP93_01550 [Treponema sp.]|jgi:hypothetical protein|nr:hypothetical protein [Treponema sp.]